MTYEVHSKPKIKIGVSLKLITVKKVDTGINYLLSKGIEKGFLCSVVL